MTFRAGFVNIIGNPNVGKSTLLNALIGEKLSIVTSKAQTTRHRILGLYNTDDYQIVFSDTPGILKPANKLHKAMLDTVDMALTDADVILYVTDCFESIDKNKDYLEQIGKQQTPVIVVINKKDISSEEQILNRIQELRTFFPESDFFIVSALKGKYIADLMAKIKEHIPVHPPYYDQDDLTDRDMRFIISEMVREKIFLFYKQEIPYSVEIEVESYIEEPTIDRVSVVIHVTRDSQKSILIGKNGLALKKVGTAARLDAERFLQKKVFMQIFVKVSDDWKDNENQLKRFGYIH